MSRQFRFRMVALAASGLIFGVPLLTNASARADQLEPGARRVTFDGGVLGLSCGSKPSVEKMTVPAESTLHVINRTGHDARLELGGRPRGVIPENGAAEVLFRRGTTPVVLNPDCSATDEPQPMLVTAVPSPSALINPAPDDSDSASLPSIMSGSADQSSAADSAPPRTRSPRVRTSHSGQHDAHEHRVTPTGTASSAAADPHKKKNKVKDPVSRTDEARDPAFAGMPPGDRKTLLPADRSVAGLTAAAVPPAAATASPSGLDVVQQAGEGQWPDTVQGVGEPASAPEAEPVAAVEPLRTGRPIGLLGLTALVCAIGVLTAAIRAIVSQRASRANVA